MGSTRLGATLALLLISLFAGREAAAGNELEGVYDLIGRRADGQAYEGQARIARAGEGYVLSTRITDPRWRRPAARAALAASAGSWLFRFGAESSLPAAQGRGLAGAVSGQGTQATSVAGGAGGMSLRVRDLGHCFEGTLLRDGKPLATEYLRRRDEALALTTFPPRLDTFVPHRPDGPNRVTVRYELDPPGAALEVSARVLDREGKEVYRERVADAVDQGEGLAFTWTGRQQSGQGWVDVRRSPFRIELSVTRGAEQAAGAPVEVRALPLLDGCWVVSREREGDPLTADAKLVAAESRPLITAVVRAIVSGARAAERGRTERAYFLVTAEGEALPATRAVLPKLGAVRLEAWDAARFGALELRWQTVQPLALHSPAYRATQNEQRKTRDGEFTNVQSNGDGEGRWLGRDTIEYAHADAGRGPSPTADLEPGTVRYRVDVDYGTRELWLGSGVRPGSPGKRDPEPTTASELRSGLAAADVSRDLGGASDSIHRISRRGRHADSFLSCLEAYRRVPWLYGSLPQQTEHLIGYDCADLAIGAARKAGIKLPFTNAHNLCQVYLAARGKHPVLRVDAQGRTVDAKTGEPAPVPSASEGAGADAETARPGDLVFWDWDGDGKWDHTTILWSCPDGTLSLDAELVWAHHDGHSPDGFHVGRMSELVRPGNPVVRFTVRRFKNR
ncbi:MAG: hypothetical protein AB7N76_24840 [Planctomycetota bacterium]